MEIFLAKTFAEKLPWVESLWKKWVQSRYSDDISLLQVCNFFLGVAPQCMKELIIDVRNKKDEFYPSNILYHIAAKIQMLLKEQDSKVEIRKHKAASFFHTVVYI